VCRVIAGWLRGLVLTLASVAVLSPFVWLIAAAFKDRSVFSEFIFSPPLDEWSRGTLNLNDFRELFAGQKSVRGTVYYVHDRFDQDPRRALARARVRDVRRSGIDRLDPGADRHPPRSALTVSFLFRQAIMSVPNEIIDAGRVDGCSEFGIYYRLVMPLLKRNERGLLHVRVLAQWNAFFAPIIFLQSQNNLTAPIVVRTYISLYSQDFGAFLAGTLLAIIPPGILFFALQNEFISGLSSGAVKG
jgi:ABC-type glycerol-3-phosphate transport system permease component